MEAIPALIKQFLKKTEGTGANIFDLLLEEIQYLFYGKKAKTLQEMKERDVKIHKGTFWEMFCYHYLVAIKEYDEVWRWKDLSEEIREKLGIKKRKDLGIDIVCRDGDEYIAIQCKFRKTRNVTWKDLGTFISYCERTGPYKKHIVMTNQEKVNWEGKRGKKDTSICRATFEGLSRKDWKKISGIKESKGIKLERKVENPTSLGELRERRLAFFEKQAEKSIEL